MSMCENVYASIYHNVLTVPLIIYIYIIYGLLIGCIISIYNGIVKYMKYRKISSLRIYEAHSGSSES